MGSDQYPPQTKIRLFCNFDVDGVMTDPAAINLVVRDPRLVSTTYDIGALIRTATGKFHIDIIPANIPGTWVARWRSTGNCDATFEDSFRIRDTVIP